jgi:hypothetical protein
MNHRRSGQDPVAPAHPRRVRNLSACILSLLCLSPAVVAVAQANDAALLRSYIDLRQPIPPGDYVVGRTEGPIAIALHTGDQVLGYGVTITLEAGANAHVFNAQDATDVLIVGVTINGRATEQTAYVHGIRLANVSGVTVRDVRIVNTRGYGIGCQQGLCADLFLDNITLEHTGLDGIDVKNRTNANTGLFLSNVRIVDPGVLGDAQAGIDIRGPAIVSRVFVTDLRTGHSGIRLRADGTGGLGGHGSVVEGFHVRGASQSFGVRIEPGVRNSGVGVGVCVGILTCVDGPRAATSTSGGGQRR